MWRVAAGPDAGGGRRGPSGSGGDTASW